MLDFLRHWMRGNCSGFSYSIDEEIDSICEKVVKHFLQNLGPENFRQFITESRIQTDPLPEQLCLENLVAKEVQEIDQICQQSVKHYLQNLPPDRFKEFVVMASQNPEDQQLSKQFRLEKMVARQSGEQQFAGNYITGFRTENNRGSRTAATIMPFPAAPALSLIESFEADTGHKFPPYVPKKRKSAEKAEQKFKKWAADLGDDEVVEISSVKIEKRTRSSSRHGSEAPQANGNVSAQARNYAEVRCSACGFGQKAGEFMICCHACSCDKVFHMTCIGLENEVPQNPSQFVCPDCQVEMMQSKAHAGSVVLRSDATPPATDRKNQSDGRAARARVKEQRSLAGFEMEQNHQRRINGARQIQAIGSRKIERNGSCQIVSDAQQISPDSRGNSGDGVRFSKRARRERQPFSPQPVLLSQELANLVQEVDIAYDNYADELEEKRKRKASRSQTRHRSARSDRSGDSSFHGNDSAARRGKQRKVYCICGGPDDTDSMIQCHGCENWFHDDCIGMTDELAETIRRYFCDACQAADPIGCRTVYVGQKIARVKREKPALSDAGPDSAVVKQEIAENNPEEPISQEPENLPEVNKKAEIADGDVIKTEIKQEEAAEENEIKPAMAQEMKPVIPRKEGLRERKPIIKPIKVKKVKVVKVRKPKPPPKVTRDSKLQRIHKRRPKFQPNLFYPAKIRNRDKVQVDINDFMDWFDPFAIMMINDFEDVNDGEKLMLNQWNSIMYPFLAKHEYARSYMPLILRLFLAKHGAEIRAHGRDGNFMMHLVGLLHYGAISKADLSELNQELAAIPRGQFDEMVAANSQAGSSAQDIAPTMVAVNSQPGSSQVVDSAMVAINLQAGSSVQVINPAMVAVNHQAGSSAPQADFDTAVAAFKAQMRASEQAAIDCANAMVAAALLEKSAAEAAVEPAMVAVNQEAGCSSAQNSNEACSVKENVQPATSQ